QAQADALGLPVERPAVLDAAALGAAYLAGLATGVWAGPNDLAHAWRRERLFEPRLGDDERASRLARWQEHLAAPPARGGGAVAVRLAEEMTTLRGSALPPDVLARANDLFLDFLGVALAGVPEDSSRALRQGLERLGLHGDATVLGTTGRLPPPQAALAN